MMEVRFMSQDGNLVGRIEVEFQLEASDELQPGEMHSLCVPLKLGNLPLPRPDSYSFELLIDGIHQTSVPFLAKLLENPLEGII